VREGVTSRGGDFGGGVGFRGNARELIQAGVRKRGRSERRRSKTTKGKDRERNGRRLPMVERGKRGFRVKQKI